MDPADDATHEPLGRFFLIAGERSDAIAQALTATLPRAASVDGPVVGAMFAQEGPGEPDLEQTFLRYTAGIALADSFRFAGYDAIVADVIPAEHIEAYLDFASPAPVHLVWLGEASRDEVDVPGLHLAAGAISEVVDEILARLDEALVETAQGDG